jgi:hypothetical protein
MKVLFAAALMVGTTAHAEIACTRVSGCWETGRTVRLPNNPANGIDTKIVARGSLHRNVKAPDKTLDEITPNQRYRHRRQPVFNSSDDDQGD